MEFLSAAVTPFDAKGKVDVAGMIRLLAWLRSSGVTGVVIAGTNGEGPSLSNFEKRDLIQQLVPIAGIPVYLGISTPSIEDAIYLGRSAATAGAAGVLLMGPGYFRDATQEGLTRWFEAYFDRTDVDTILYNFPKFTGHVLSPELLRALADRPRLIGLKDSSGERANLADYAAALPGKRLFVGDETLLPEALAAGWVGTISGASNSLAPQIAGALFDSGDSQIEKFKLLMPQLAAVRAVSQPMGHKKALVEMGILERADVRLPLQ